MGRKPRTRYDYDGACSLCGGIKVWCATGGCASCTPPPAKKVVADARSQARKAAQKKSDERRRLIAERAQELSVQREKLPARAVELPKIALISTRLADPVPLPPKDRHTPFLPEEAKLMECRLMVRRVMQNVCYPNMERIFE